MKIGFSTLSQFMKSTEEMVSIASRDGFDMIELLSEGPSRPEILLENPTSLKSFKETDLEIKIHAPTIDVNLASINPGIRQESIRQTQKALDLADAIGATSITTHPGIVHRREKYLREMAMELLIDSIKQCVEHTETLNTKISVENMPERFSFLCNQAEELERVVNECGCEATIDLGHANTTPYPEEFLDIPHIGYYHLNDNNGEKDQHLPLGEGTLNLELLKKVDKGIIELNNYDNVLKTQELLKKYI